MSGSAVVALTLLTRGSWLNDGTARQPEMQSRLQPIAFLTESAWIRPLIVYPCVLHFGAIVLDSTFAFGWGIAKLPAPYDGYEQAIILSYFIAQPFEKVARVFTAMRK